MVSGNTSLDNELADEFVQTQPTRFGSRERFYLLNVGIPLLCGLAIFLMFDITDLDRTIINWFWDPVKGVFPLEHNHTFEKITHKWARILPDLVGELSVIGAALSFLWPRFAAFPQSSITRFIERVKLAPLLRFTTKHRRDFFFIVVAFALSQTVVHYLKSHTSVFCPVETTLYGGAEIRHEWYQQFNLLHKAGVGRCWPGGHASSAFDLLAVYFIARRYRWQYSTWLLNGCLLLGLAYGTSRMVQGWHYMSHNLWSAVLVWLATLLIALFFYGRKTLDQPLLKGKSLTAD